MARSTSRSAKPRSRAARTTPKALPNRKGAPVVYKGEKAARTVYSLRQDGAKVFGKANIDGAVRRVQKTGQVFRVVK